MSGNELRFSRGMVILYLFLIATLTITTGVLVTPTVEPQTAETAETPQTEQEIVWIQDRITDAEDFSRSMERQERIQERIEARKERQERRQARQERQEAREAVEVVYEPPAPTQQPQERSSGDLPELLMFIRSNESGGNYQAVNWSGCEGHGCFGAYQLHGLYADDWARRYGAGEWAGTNPSGWPPEVQDKVAIGLFYSTSPDGSHWCDWTTYC
jgi:hypothetical protein